MGITISYISFSLKERTKIIKRYFRVSLLCYNSSVGDKMEPKYKYMDTVEFSSKDKTYSGKIQTYKNEGEIVYDILGIDTCVGTMFKDIKESSIIRKISKTVLCYIERNDKYLMLLRNKRKNDYNKDKWLGIGGHIMNKEDKEDALIREVKEETGLDLLDYKERGIIYFHDTNYLEIMYLYTSNSFRGFLTPCDEGTLAWIEKKEIFNLNLWDGDKYFLKEMMDTCEYFEMHLYYEDGNFIRSEKI